MATSKDILFWAPRGQLLRNQCIVPVTNISELVEYVLFPPNEDVAKPLNNKYLPGLAELGVNKNLIKNKKLLRDLLEKEQTYNDKGESDNEASDGDSSESGAEETASETKSERQESERDSDSSEQEAETDNKAKLGKLTPKFKEK